jgi:hypothetical protein
MDDWCLHGLIMEMRDLRYQGRSTLAVALWTVRVVYTFVEYFLSQKGLVSTQNIHTFDIKSSGKRNSHYPLFKGWQLNRRVRNHTVSAPATCRG